MAIRALNVTPLLQVYDMRKSVAWYCEEIGFELVQKHEPDGHLYWAMLKLGDATIMLNSRFEDDQRPATPPGHTGHGDVTLYFHCPNVDETYEIIRAKVPNVKPPQVTYYGMKQLTITDPDGFELCFQHPA